MKTTLTILGWMIFLPASAQLGIAPRPAVTAPVATGATLEDTQKWLVDKFADEANFEEEQQKNLKYKYRVSFKDCVMNVFLLKKYTDQRSEADKRDYPGKDPVLYAAHFIIPLVSVDFDAEHTIPGMVAYSVGKRNLFKHREMLNSDLSYSGRKASQYWNMEPGVLEEIIRTSSDYSDHFTINELYIFNLKLGISPRIMNAINHLAQLCLIEQTKPRPKSVTPPGEIF